MIKIQAHRNRFIPEITYIVQVIFGEFLGYEYVLEFHDLAVYRIELPNGNTLVMNDHFFSQISAESSYSNKYLPQSIGFEKNVFAPEDDFVVIYGTGQMTFAENCITFNADLFASAFFMLTRWEEYVTDKRDPLGRFQGKESLAYRNQFLHRPVVDEYVEMIRRMMKHLGYFHDDNKHSFSVKLTHDVDRIERFSNLSSGFRQIAAELFVNRNIRQSFYTTKSFINCKLFNKADPYDTFDFFMEQAEKLNTRAEFYFIPYRKGENEARYDIGCRSVHKAIKKIQNRGHIVGIHPSKNTFDNPQQLKEEKTRLEHVFGCRIAGGRHHFLRINIPQTWQMWEDIGLEYDSSMGYNDINGFRAGTCHSFPLFNFLTRQTLKLREYPLTVMEVCFKTLSPEQMQEETEKLLNCVKKYNGCFVWLWHTINWNAYEWAPYQPVYQNIILQIESLH